MYHYWRQWMPQAREFSSFGTSLTTIYRFLTDDTGIITENVIFKCTCSMPNCANHFQSMDFWGEGGDMHNVALLPPLNLDMPGLLRIPSGSGAQGIITGRCTSSSASGQQCTGKRKYKLDGDLKFGRLFLAHCSEYLQVICPHGPNTGIPVGWSNISSFQCTGIDGQRMEMILVALISERKVRDTAGHLVTYFFQNGAWYSYDDRYNIRNHLAIPPLNIQTYRNGEIVSSETVQLLVYADTQP